MRDLTLLEAEFYKVCQRWERHPDPVSRKALMDWTIDKLLDEALVQMAVRDDRESMVV